MQLVYYTYSASQKSSNPRCGLAHKWVRVARVRLALACRKRVYNDYSLVNLHVARLCARALASERECERKYVHVYTRLRLNA